MEKIEVDDIVDVETVFPQRRFPNGIVRYVGPLSGKKGIWIGIEFDRAMFSCSGDFCGVQYFTTKLRNSGAFFHPICVRVIRKNGGVGSSSSSPEPPALEPPALEPQPEVESDMNHSEDDSLAQEMLLARRLDNLLQSGSATLEEAIQKVMEIEKCLSQSSKEALEIQRLWKENKERLAEFDSVADQLKQRFNIVRTAEQVRKEVVAWLRNHEDFEIMDGLLLKEVFGVFEVQFNCLEEYCEYMEQDKRWGDIWTLIAAAHLYNVRICIFSSTKDADEETHRLFFGPSDAPMIFLGHIIELHYVSLLDGLDSLSVM